MPLSKQQLISIKAHATQLYNTLDVEERSSLLDLFNTMDVDNSGHVDYGEFATFLNGGAYINYRLVLSNPNSLGDR